MELLIGIVILGISLAILAWSDGIFEKISYSIDNKILRISAKIGVGLLVTIATVVYIVVAFGGG
jgi:hypothetical protein